MASTGKSFEESSEGQAANRPTPERPQCRFGKPTRKPRLKICVVERSMVSSLSGWSGNRAREQSNAMGRSFSSPGFGSPCPAFFRCFRGDPVGENGRLRSRRGRWRIAAARNRIPTHRWRIAAIRSGKLPNQRSNDRLKFKTGIPRD